MADLSSQDIKRIEQAFTQNDRDNTLVEKLKQTINTNTSACHGVTYSIAAEDSDTITVSCQFTNADGEDCATAVCVQQYLSSDSAGQTRVAAATSLAVGTDGTILVEYTSNSIWSAVSETDGDLDIVIGDASGAATYYLNTVLPDGRLDTSAVITFAA